MIVNNSSDLILDVIQDLHPNKDGIKFLINFLNDNFDERSKNTRKTTLMEMFYLNVKHIPNIPQSREVWEKIKANGDVKNAIISSFDWDLSPEGSEYWLKVNNKFLEAYENAKQHGLKYNENTPMRNTNYDSGFYPHTTPYDFNESTSKEVQTSNERKHYTDIQIMPTQETLALMSYIAPTCKHLVNPQIDILTEILTENKCSNEFYANLRNKPKHAKYEEEFGKFIKTGDIRTIVYWAFNWSSTKEGFHFWSTINAKVHSAITKELTNGGSRTSTVLDIKHESEGFSHNNRPNVMPLQGPNRSLYCGYPHYDLFYDCDDYCDYESFDYEGYYGSGYSYSTPKVPTEIINMKINNNYIEVNVTKATEEK